MCLLMSASDRYIGYKIEEHRRQHPDERLLVAGRTAGAEPQSAADCRNSLRRHAVPDGYAPCGNRWEMRSNVLIDTAFRVVRGDVRPPLAVRPIGRSAVGDLYPPAVRGRAGPLIYRYSVISGENLWPVTKKNIIFALPL